MKKSSFQDFFYFSFNLRLKLISNKMSSFKFSVVCSRLSCLVRFFPFTIKFFDQVVLSFTVKSNFVLGKFSVMNQMKGNKIHNQQHYEMEKYKNNEASL